MHQKQHPSALVRCVVLYLAIVSNLMYNFFQLLQTICTWSSVDPVVALFRFFFFPKGNGCIFQGIPGYSFLPCNLLHCQLSCREVGKKILWLCSCPLSCEDLRSMKAEVSLLSWLVALDAVDSVHISRILQDCLTFEMCPMCPEPVWLYMSCDYICITEHDITFNVKRGSRMLS